MLIRVLLVSLVVSVFLGCSPQEQSGSAEADKPKPLVVYSSRKEHLIKPLFDSFTASTGIEVQYITDKAGPLIARLAAEGQGGPADVLITVDAGNLWQAAQQNLLLPADSPVLQERVPASLRDPQNRWFGLSIRSRAIVYSTERTNTDELDSYESLADPKWAGRLCLRSSKKVYNQSLVATMIAANGLEQTEKIVGDWVSNLAVAPFSDDTKVMEAILAGQCDVGIVNSYYFGRLEKKNPALALKLFWPNQNDRGSHINISGAGITYSSANKEAATALIEWMASDDSQQLFMNLNQEYPINPAIPLIDSIKAWGDFKMDPINIAKAGELQAQAVKLMDRAGYK